MKRLFFLAVSAVLAGCSESPMQPAAGSDLSVSAAVDAAPGHNKLVCFESGAATCTNNTKGAKGSATLTVTGPGDASVYYEHYNGSIYGVKLSDITMLSFTYTGTPTAGSPRFSIPVDTDNDGNTNFWAYVSAYYCNNGAGLVDPINNPNCTIYVGNTPYVGWAAFVAAYPNAEVALTDNYLFVISDDVGTWTVNNVIIGKPGK